MTERADMLKAAAQRAGMVTLDALALAKPELAPEDAVPDLRVRFPAAFAPLDVRGMDRKDYQAARATMLRAVQVLR